MTLFRSTGLALTLAMGCLVVSGCATKGANIHGAHPGSAYNDSANTPTNQHAWGSSDEAIAQNVRAALQGNAAINSGATIKVQVNQGEVLLSGSATSAEDRIRAIRTVERVRGVRKVTARITTN